MGRLPTLLVLAVLGLNVPLYGQQIDGAYILVYRMHSTVRAVDTADSNEVEIPIRGFFVIEIEPEGQATDAVVVLYGKNEVGEKIYFSVALGFSDLFLSLNPAGNFVTAEMNIYKGGNAPHSIVMTGHLKSRNVGLSDKKDAAKRLRGNMTVRKGKIFDDFQSPIGSSNISAVLTIGRTRQANKAMESISTVTSSIVDELVDKGYVEYDVRMRQ